MKRWVLGALVAAVAAALAQPVQSAAGADNIWIAGSSAIQPFTTAVAVRAAKAAGGSAPIVEETGTALAFEYLCGGAGFPNAASVTRRMKRSELDACRGNGVAEVVELPVGLDILVVAQSKSGPLKGLTLAQMFLALAKQVPGGNGALIANPYRKWSQIDAALPDTNIDVRLLPQALGTRDDLQDLFLYRGAERIPALARLMKKDAALRKTASLMRRDPSVLVEQETEDVIVRELVANPNAVGIFGYRFLQANRGKLRSVMIDGADAEQDAYSGRYPGSRRVYIYARKADFETVPGLDRLGAEYVSSAALGPDGFLLKMGFVPLPAEEMALTMDLVKALPAVSRDMLPE